MTGQHLYRTHRRAFSLIELLIVILIIAVVIALVLPAVGKARDAAKKADTQTLCAQITASCQTYFNDNHRQPGYFSQAEMGSSENETRGLTQMKNIMIDLTGTTSTAVLSQEVIDVGPRASTLVRLDTSKGNGKYLQLPPKNLVVQQQGAQYATNVPAHAQLADVVDSWGTPLLAWSDNEAAIGPIKFDSGTGPGPNNFARHNSSSAALTPAHYYWAANAGFLNATSLGKKGQNQQTESLLGTMVGGDPEATLTAITGNPSYPDDASKTYDKILPTASRGSVIIHSAGVNGVYVGKNEMGAKSGNGTTIWFGLNIKTTASATSYLTDTSGKPATIDILSKFDDIIVSTN